MEIKSTATGDRKDQSTNIIILDSGLSKDIPIEISIRMLEPLQLPKNGLLTVNKYIMNTIENIATIPETSSHNAL